MSLFNSKDKTSQLDKAAASSGQSYNTQPTKDGGPVISYASRVSGSFALIAAMTALILVLVLALVWDNEFADYTRSNMQSLARSTAASIADRYDIYKYWAPQVLEPASNASDISTGIGIQILDSYDNPVYDDTWITTGGNLNGIDLSLAPAGSSSEEAPIVLDNGRRVGKVKVWAFGSEALYTQNDIAFRQSSYRAIFIAALIAIVLAVIVGFYFARSLSTPIKKITNAAQQIKDGDLSARTHLRGEDEVAHLGQIFDSMARSLEKDKELERRLTTDVAHELRTPLMAIQSTVEAIQDGVFPADDERLAVIGGETRRLSRLVDALLQLSRLESGATKFNFRKYDILDLAHSIVISHEAMINESGMNLEFINKTDKQKLVVEIDPDKMRQAVVNLLSNAVRYTDSGGAITISVAEDWKRVYIAVSDTGIGIDKDSLDSIFGRFWRAEGSRNRAAGGLGVGLSVTKEVVERHHGSIQVESEVGVGTTFTISIPKIQHHKKPETKDQAEIDEQNELERQAKDEPDIREAARKKDRDQENYFDGDDGLIG